MSRCILILISILFIGPAYAEKLNLNKAVHLFLQNSTQIKAAEHSLEAARSEYQKAWSTLYPEINLVSSVGEQKFYNFLTTEYALTRTYFAGLQMSHGIYLGGRIWKTLDLKENLRDSAQMSLQNTKRTLLVSFIDTLYKKESLRQKLELIKESKSIQEDFVKITKNKLKQGNVRSFEMDQVMAEFYSYHPRIRELEKNLENLNETIAAQLMAEKGDFVIEVDLDFNRAEVRLASEEELLNEAVQNRPDYKSTKLQLAAAKINKKLVMGEHLPSLVFQGQVGYTGSSPDTLFDVQDTGNSFSLSLSIPIFSGLSSVHSRRAAESQIFSAEKGFVQTQKNLRAELRQALEDYNSSRESIVYTGKWAKNAESALLKARKSYRSGIINNTQIVQLQQSKERAASALIDAKVAVKMSALKLKSVLGRDLL